MYRVHGFQDKDQLLEMLVKDDNMTFFPEFNLLAVTSSFDPSEEPETRQTAIFNVKTHEIASGEFFKGCDYVSDMVFEGGQCKALAIIDSYEQDSDGFTFHDRRIDMLSRLFSWSSTITAGSISDMVRRASYYQKHLMSNRESFELSHGKPLSEISERPVGADAKELLDKLTSSETVSYFPEFNLLVTTTEYDPLGLHDRDTCVFNVFPSELAYENLFHGFENVVDIPYSGPVVDPIAFQPTFIDSAERDRSNDVDLGSLAMLLSGSDVISTQSVPELLETMADRFGIEPEERTLNANRAQAEECIRTGVPDIQVEIDCTNDDNFIEGTVTVEASPATSTARTILAIPRIMTRLSWSLSVPMGSRAISRKLSCPPQSIRIASSPNWSCPWRPSRIWIPTRRSDASRALIRFAMRRPRCPNR